jgi:hypothetical protein
VNDTTALDQQSDARLRTPPTAGVGENKASVGSNGQPVPADSASDPTKPAAPAAEGPLPTNHPVSAKQMKELERMQKKAADKAKKQLKNARPAATPPAANDASSTPPAPKQ